MSQPLIAGTNIQLQNVTINVVGGDQANYCESAAPLQNHTSLIVRQRYTAVPPRLVGTRLICLLVLCSLHR